MITPVVVFEAVTIPFASAPLAGSRITIVSFIEITLTIPAAGVIVRTFIPAPAPKTTFV